MEGCRVSVWAHLCPSGPPLFIIPNKLTPHGTGYSQCVCQSWDNKVRGAGGRQGGTGCAQGEKMGQKHPFFSTLFTQPTFTAYYAKPNFSPTRLGACCIQFCKPPVGVLGSLRINQPPTHSPPFTQQLFLHFGFFTSTFRFLYFYISVSLFLHFGFIISTFRFHYFYISVSLFLHFRFFTSIKIHHSPTFHWSRLFLHFSLQSSVLVLQTPLELTRPSSL